MKRRVLVRHSFDLWEDWEVKYSNKDHIEFYYNEGTSCGNNILREILKYRKSIGLHDCLCHIQSSRVLEIK